MNSLDENALLVRASAGSGKTFQLVHRYLALLSEGISPKTILATTFTRKAAFEISDRILERLAELSRSETVREEVFQVNRCRIQKAKAEEILAHLLFAPEELQVYTLDSFVMQLSKLFQSELGLPEIWRKSDSEEENLLAQRGIQSLCSSLDRRDLDQLLSLMVGIEASRSVVSRLEYELRAAESLFEESAGEGWGLKADSFTPPSRDSVKAALKAVSDFPVPSNNKGPLVSWQKALQEVTTRFEAGNWQHFLKAGLSKKVAAKDYTYRGREIDEGLRLAIDTLLGRAAEALVDELNESTASIRLLVSQYANALVHLRKRTRKYSFLQLKFLLLRIFSNYNREELFFRLDSRLHHLLLDEFQDTSRLEWRLLEPFVSEILAHPSEERSFFCVGDTKQAIYGWRGGDSKLFDEIADLWPHLGSKPLHTSYRSAKPIIDFVNGVFSGLQQRPCLSGYSGVARRWDTLFTPHQTAKEKLLGSVSVEEVPKGEKLSRLGAAVQAAREEDPGQSIAVLVRRNEAVAQVLNVFQNVGITASEEGGNPLTDSWGVVCITALLGMIEHPGDLIYRCHTANSPLGEKLGYRYWRSDRETFHCTARLRRKISEQSLSEVIREMGNALSLSGRELRRYKKLHSLAIGMESNTSLQLSDFLRAVRERKFEDPQDEQIRVMTVHQAKGLEFDSVFLPELDQNLREGRPPRFLVRREGPAGMPVEIVKYAGRELQSVVPELKELAEAAQEESLFEELCVFYVAVTRAAKHLTLFLEADASASILSYAQLVRESTQGPDRE